MPEITGYATGVPRTCPWCWEKTTDIGVGPGGIPMPLHVTCAMQMLIIYRRVANGFDPGHKVAGRRYWRFVRMQRKIERARRKYLTNRAGGAILSLPPGLPASQEGNPQ